MSLTYLSTLQFDDAWLAALRSAVPGLAVHQVSAATAAEVSAELWGRVDVLHTATALPDPGDAPRLRLVQLDTAGVDHVAGTALWRSDVPIASLGGIAGVPMAEYVLMSVLALAHRVPALLAARAAHDWAPTPDRLRAFTPRALPGSTMLVVGYGRIGREVARLARAFGIEVIGVRRRGEALRAPVDGTVAGEVGPPDPGGPVRLVSLDQLPDVLPLADHVVVLLPSTPATWGCVDSAAIALLRPGATVVNASRGGIVDTAALVAAVHAGRLAGAALDVFDVEPLPATDPLWDDPHILLTPHVAGFAPRYAEGVAQLVTDNLRRLVAGRPLLNLVDRESGY